MPAANEQGGVMASGAGIPIANNTYATGAGYGGYGGGADYASFGGLPYDSAGAPP